MAVASVPLFDASAVNSCFDLEPAVRRVLQRHWYVLGEEVRRFEQDFAAYCGVPHCVALANGTDAIELALRGLGIGPGDTVVLAANAGYYGSTAVALVGARPVYADIDPATLNIDVAAVESLIQAHRPKAVIATHLYGLMADVQALAQVARKSGVFLVEDCAQSHGARRNGAIAGSVGDIACFSFYPTKNLGALGDGGAIVCKDERLASTVRSLRQYGWGQKYHNDVAGGRNSRLDVMQAAMLSEKLPQLDRQNQQRRDIAARYCEAFAGLPLVLPASVGHDYVAHLFVVRTPSRDALREHLRTRGIATDVHYPVPDHKQAVAAGVKHAELPHTERACREVLTLPCYPGMQDGQVQQVIDGVRSWFDAQASR